MVKYELSTVRAVLTAANKNVAARRFSATFQLFRQLLFRRRPGFLQVFLFTYSTTCLYHPCIFYCTRQAFKCWNAQISNAECDEYIRILEYSNIGIFLIRILIWLSFFGYEYIQIFVCVNFLDKGSPDIKKTVKKGDIVPFWRPPPLNR